MTRGRQPHPSAVLVRADGRLPYFQEARMGGPATGAGDSFNQPVRLVWLTPDEAAVAKRRARSARVKIRPAAPEELVVF